MKKGLLIFGSVLILSGVGVWAYGRWGKHSDGNANFDSVLKNLGVSADKNGVASVKFNSGENIANFYSNGRVVVFKGTTELAKGSYSNGGSTITLDGKAPITEKTVYLALLKTV
jgi:hypothetical protein